MLDVKVDLIKNRLYLTLRWIQKNKIRNAMPVIERAAAKLAPGFSCVTRIIDTRQVNTADMAEIKNVHQCLITYGMHRVVRVGAAPDKHRLHLVGKQWRFLSQNADLLEDAERLLDEPTAEPIPVHHQAAN